MRKFAFGMATVAAACALSAVASGAMMHPVLAAKLAGMGEHGVVNLQSNAGKGQLCWTFDVMTDGVTGASIRDSGGMVVREASWTDVQGQELRRGSGEGARPDRVEARLLQGSGWTTKGHPGDLRGTLFVGMAHM